MNKTKICANKKTKSERNLKVKQVTEFPLSDEIKKRVRGWYFKEKEWKHRRGRRNV